SRRDGAVAPPGRGSFPPLAPDGTRGGRVQARAPPRRTQRGLLVRAPRHPRRRDPPADTVPRRPGPGRVLGAGDRARARIPGAVRLPTTARARVPVLLLAVGTARHAP